MDYVLVTGGLGYIGSHTVIELIENGYTNIIIVDNLSNCSLDILNHIETLTNIRPIFIECDLRTDVFRLETIFSLHSILFVIHFAALKSVEESILFPMLYYQNNVIGTMNLIHVMQKFHCYNLIFSSSATVYGTVNSFPVKEDNITGQNITNPYGKTKYMIEEILKDISKADDHWSIIILRYFNPIGHRHSLLKENPSQKPNNLFPILRLVSENKIKKLQIYGNNHETKDGTCERDFIHVTDVAKGHIVALTKLKKSGLFIYNLGRGCSISVMELLKKTEQVNHISIPFEIVGKRNGDIPIIFANVTKAEKELKWKAMKTLDDMCQL